MNAGPDASKCPISRDLRHEGDEVSVFCPCPRDADCLFTAPNDATLLALIEAWPRLENDVRAAILALANAATR